MNIKPTLFVGKVQQIVEVSNLQHQSKAVFGVRKYFTISNKPPLFPSTLELSSPPDVFLNKVKIFDLKCAKVFIKSDLLFYFCHSEEFALKLAKKKKSPNPADIVVWCIFRVKYKQQQQ